MSWDGIVSQKDLNEVLSIRAQEYVQGGGALVDSVHTSMKS